MRIIFAINHPAQYHLLKNPYHRLIQKGHNVVFVIKGKDILEELMISEGVEYSKLTNKRVGTGRISVLLKGLLELFVQDFQLLRFARRFKPDLMVGTDYCITHIGKIIRKPSIVLNEDDFSVNKLFCKLAYPFANCILSPEVCDVSKYQNKKVGYKGYQKLSYLHPNVFNPDINIVKQYISADKYFIIRLVSFSAGHDIEKKHGGIEKHNLIALVELLEKHGKVYITSESKIPKELEEYKLTIDVKHIHHILAYATLFIADSQSMIVEAAMLGIPSIRFNSFVGSISVLEELQGKYGLTVGIHNSNVSGLFSNTEAMLEEPELASKYKIKRDMMLKDKIDVSSFLVWFFENYPNSRKKIIEDPQYQNTFK